MLNKSFINGMLAFGAGLGMSSLSSFLGHFVVFGGATNFAQGFCNGLSVIAYIVAIWFLVRSRKAI